VNSRSNASSLSSQPSLRAVSTNRSYCRLCHAIEVHSAYVDVSVIRWQNFTGQKAALDSTGETFDTTKAARAREDRIDVAIAKKRISEIEANGVKSPGSATSGTKTARASKAKTGASPPS
jgi:hypothetical protein